MGLDIAKLQNRSESTGGKITARCPACAAAGGDSKGEHLVVFPDGKYGCVANEGDEKHRKEIFRLVGSNEMRTRDTEKITVNSVNIPPPRVVMDLGEFCRFSKKPLELRVPIVPSAAGAVDPPLPVVETVCKPAMKAPAKRSAPQVVQVPEVPVAQVSPYGLSATREEVRAFLQMH